MDSDEQIRKEDNDSRESSVNFGGPSSLYVSIDVPTRFNDLMINEFRE